MSYGLRRVAGIAIKTLFVLAAGAVAFVIAFYVAMKVEMRTTEVKVPELSGRTLGEASRVAGAAGLVVEVVDQRNDAAMSSGRVLQQEPPAGSSVRRGRKIKLVVSLGGKVLSVPDLVGRGSRASEIELRRDGFQAGPEARVYRPRIPVGEVVAQVPPPGTPAVPGTRVHRLVSDGEEPPVWVMPELGGRTQESAERWIDRWGFRRGAVRLASAPDRVPGTVIGQLPLAGYPISVRGIVDLTVAR